MYYKRITLNGLQLKPSEDYICDISGLFDGDNDVTLNNFSLFLVCHPKECTGSNTANQQFGFGDVNNNISIRTTNATTNNLIIEVTNSYK